jgi:excisionase family DNA binding protein
MSQRVGERRFTSDRRRGDRRQAAVALPLQEHRAIRRVERRRRTDRVYERGSPATRPAVDASVRHNSVPVLLTADEVAAALRTSRKAVYAMIERGYLPGLVRVRRRILVRQASLLQWLQEKGAPSLKGD